MNCNTTHYRANSSSVPGDPTLFGEDGRLRIADFGLARALAEAAWTEPQGAVLGTARYASPEQAQGEAVDGRADVYSLGLVLIESVTGQVPFTADTTIGTLMARVGKAVEVPAAMGALRKLLERAGQPDPGDRPDAGELGVGLMAIAGDLPRPEPFPLVTSDLSDVLAPPSDDDATLHGLARGTDAPTRLVQPGDETVVDLPPTSGMPLVDLDDVEGFEAHPRRHRWLRPLLVLLVLAGLGAGGYVAYDRLAAVPTYAVPKLTDLSADAANSAVLEAGHGWKVRKETARKDGSVVGSILRQEPAFGEELKRDGTITLYISAGNTLADVPPATALVGKTYDEAVQILQVAGFGAKRVDVTSEDVGKDTVLGFHLEEGETDPSRLPKQTEVALDVSSGPAPRTVPAELGDGSYEAAAAAIQAVQLVPKKVEVFDDTAPAGKVVGTSPAAGASVPRDGTVEVRVSKGPDLVKVPAVKGLTLQQAISALEGAGLTVGDVFGPAKGQPFTTQPEAGTSVKRGTTVDIYLK